MSGPTQALPRERAHAIAAPFRGDPGFGNRWNYFYTRTKLGSDPLYPSVAHALHDTTAPLLDLGCGLGLLAHTLREAGIALPYYGVDIDASKIAHARRIAERAQLADVRFEAMDLSRTLPVHHGSVALLDVLQYVDTDAQVRILDAAASMLAPGGRLVIRSGLATPGWRSRVTHVFDAVAAYAGWMYSPPRRYPTEALLRGRLEAAGLRHELMSLAGNTPFNNWRIVAWRE